MRFAPLALAATLTLGLATAPALFAQGPGGQGRGGMQARALQGITLTPTQQAQVDSITTAARAMMPARTQGVPMSEADRTKAMNIMMGSVQDIRGILTPDQQKVYDKNVAAMRQQMQERMQNSGGTPATPGTPPKPE